MGGALRWYRLVISLACGDSIWIDTVQPLHICCTRRETSKNSARGQLLPSLSFSPPVVPENLRHVQNAGGKRASLPNRPWRRPRTRRSNRGGQEDGRRRQWDGGRGWTSVRSSRPHYGADHAGQNTPPRGRGGGGRILLPDRGTGSSFSVFYFCRERWHGLWEVVGALERWAATAVSTARSIFVLLLLLVIFLGCLEVYLGRRKYCRGRPWLYQRSSFRVRTWGLLCCVPPFSPASSPSGPRAVIVRLAFE